MTNFAEHIGAAVLALIRELGKMLIFVVSAFAWLIRPPLRVVQMIKQLHFIG